jgi:hypothetical protein
MSFELAFMAAFTGRAAHRTELQGRFCVRDLIDLHLLDDLPGAQILLRQRRQMALEVSLDLTLGFGQETQIGRSRSAPRACRWPASRRTRRVEQALAPPSSAMRRSVQARCSVSWAAPASAFLMPSFSDISACP